MVTNFSNQHLDEIAKFTTDGFLNRIPLWVKLAPDYETSFENLKNRIAKSPPRTSFVFSVLS